MCRSVSRRFLPCNQVVATNVCQQRQLRIKEVRVDVYALAGLRAREQSGENGRLGVETGGEVCQRAPRK